MIIKEIFITNDGYVHCKSNFYSSQDILNSASFNFGVGINKLTGEIDSGIWAISYLLSMYKHRPQDFILFEQPKVTVNSQMISLNELSKFSCYMDELDPLFSSKHSVKKLITQGLSHSKSNCSYDDIKNLFCLDNERFKQPLKSVGNERFRAMAAIGYSYGKQVFCFPWLSHSRFEHYSGQLMWLFDLLKNLDKICILPIGIKA